MIIGDCMFTSFFKLSHDDKSKILEWRNNESTRRWMYTSTPISTESHLAFIDRLETDATKKYFVVSYHEEQIGVIYFTSIENKIAEFGLYSNPTLKGKGNKLMSCICEYGFKVLQLNKLTAEVFYDNEKAIKLYRSFDFQETGSDLQHNKKVIYMELNNENR